MDVVVLGLNGFPFSFSAKVNRYKSIARMLIKGNNNITILNRNIGKLNYQDDFLIKNNRINVVNCSSISISSYTVNKYLKKIMPVFELLTLLSLVKRGKQTVFLIYTPSLFLFLLYTAMGRVLGAKVVYDYVEKRSEFADRNRRKVTRFFDGLFENKMLKFADAIIVISENLKNEVKNKFTEMPFFKLPALSDFEYIDSISSFKTEPYILYCGSEAYLDVVDFIVESYVKSDVSDKLRLILVISGGTDKIEMLRTKYNKFVTISVLTKLPYNELIAYYKSAEALLIPLRNSLRDIARFPHKISEYTASRGLILTTNFGEIKEYFVHNKNALITDDYCIDSYAKLIKSIQEVRIERVKDNSYNTGKKHFSEEGNLIKLNNFLQGVYE